jgi:DNA-binding MarR family transcriptional regulator
MHLSQALDRAAEAGIDSMPRLRVLLACLDRPRNLTELSAILTRTSSRLTGIIDKMTGDGLLERTRSHGDRRSYLIALTADGRKTAAHIIGE